MSTDHRSRQAYFKLYYERKKHEILQRRREYWNALTGAERDRQLDRMRRYSMYWRCARVLQGKGALTKEQLTARDVPQRGKAQITPGEIQLTKK